MSAATNRFRNVCRDTRATIRTFDTTHKMVSSGLAFSLLRCSAHLIRRLDIRILLGDKKKGSGYAHFRLLGWINHFNWLIDLQRVFLLKPNGKLSKSDVTRPS
jgi:hypothetical protein